MKLVKFIVPVLIMAISFSAFAQDQVKKTPEEKAQRQVKAIDKECKLTSDQKSKVEQIILNSIQKTAEIRQKNMPRKDKFDTIKKINEERDAQMKTALTSEQYVKYQALVERSKEKAKDRMKTQRPMDSEN